MRMSVKPIPHQDKDTASPHLTTIFTPLSFTAVAGLSKIHYMTGENESYDGLTLVDMPCVHTTIQIQPVLIRNTTNGQYFACRKEHNSERDSSRNWHKTK